MAIPPPTGTQAVTLDDSRGLPDREPPDDRLLSEFESIGDNCEFGLVQRRAGAEPSTLLRWAFSPLSTLMQALAAGFTNIEDVRIEVRNNEYVGLIRQYGWLYHSGINADSMESARVAVVLSRRNALLRDALIGHLQQGDRLFVRKTNLPHTEGEINDLVAAMGLYGPAT